MRRGAGPVAEALLRVRGLGVAWRGADGHVRRVVDDVSFDLAPGETIGIAGESGSGKSTLARALLGHTRPGSFIEAGSVVLGGRDLMALPPSALAALRGREVAMVPQNPLSSLTFHRRVGAQVEEVLRHRAGLAAPAARLRALDLLAEMGLPEPERLARRYPHQLSGGQRQRVVLACALACDPALLVLDEPTTALDKTTEAQVLDLIRRLRAARRGGMVIVTHDLNVVAGICDRVIVMQHGKVVEEGPVRRVFAAPRETYTRVLLGAALQVEGVSRTPRREAGAVLLEAEAVRFSYARPSLLLRRAPAGPPTLADIAFTLHRGEVLGVIGESGSGKTTLGGLVSGLLAADGGTLRFDGAPLPGRAADRSMDARRRIQMVFQDPLSSLNPRRRVGEQVIRPLRLFHGLDRRAAEARAARLFDDLGLEVELLARFPRQLSGGQQQRVAIARAFAAEPDLLVCDEITSALDASVQAQLLDHLAAMQRRAGTALLLITHDLSVVWRMAGRVAVMRGGRILEQGDTATVFRAPADPYTAALLGAATRATRVAEPVPAGE
jgi:ABC-type glutathione transport system ATPase component